MIDEPRTVSDLGEFGLIDRIRARLGSPRAGELWSGDDVAVVKAPSAELLFTTDVVVEGVDFDLAYCLGADVGWKALAVNASDIAAVGGRPDAALATLTLPPTTLVSVADGIVEGLVEASTRWGVRLVGGDVSRADRIALSIALLGTADRPVLRSGARPGDALVVTGRLGGAAGGLVALRRGLAGPGPTEGHRFPVELARALTRLATRQLRPEARVEEGIRLAELGATAMIDVSDGLVADLGHLVSASGVGCEVDPGAVPVDPDLDALAAAITDEEIRPLELALEGGEDFELLFAVPPDAVPDVAAALGELHVTVTQIGWITDGAARVGDRPLDDWRNPGWDHLRGP